MQCKCGGQTRVHENSKAHVYTCVACGRRYERELVTVREKGSQYSFLDKPRESK